MGAGTGVRGALLTLLLAGPSCGGRTLLERADPNDAAPTGGGSAGGSLASQGGLSPGASGGSSSGATSSAGSTATSGGSSACRVETVLSQRPPVLEFLLDSSLSMKTALTPELSRWSALQSALGRFFTLFDENALGGLIFYPNVQLSAGSHEGDTWCFLRFPAVPVRPLDSSQQQLFRDAMRAKSPLGATPTHDAYVYALGQLQAASDPGRAHLMLVTDGAPTYGLDCSGSGDTPVDTAPLEGVVAEALLPSVTIRCAARPTPSPR